ncbi:putative DNA-binding WGR domain protein [Breznakia sp. PF5-3]|uniref:DUF6138 family protein n=1 Tax=unclassified Breznakia TaxID=2623764 RepID=UPI002406FDA4|nr:MULTISPECIES: DUF6138 family protein [unclassified Breznakia]MDF9823830.1 putative DNA-binding WGR domain protein [Breznakia sp. PM6-1]MDF9834604.1 putative DNA-binding WGR domain protein [Breznakia sp. PF5-3]MDF9836779.1 putative DNA-binding WGR domain protein [Breznakia sp. PFB2-8]MDF9858772.1 putative DNA-binding WGR domain protein [Breznakia sp. PH5-24]
MKYYLESREEGANKFWKLELKGDSYTVTYGKLGSVGTSKTKAFDSEEAAQKAAEKMVATKRKNGYEDAKELNTESPTTTIDDFMNELIPFLEEMEVELQEKFWKFYEESGKSDYHLQYHDVTWTGFINRLTITIQSSKDKKRIRNYLEFGTDEKWSSSIMKDFSEFYMHILTEENLKNVIGPKIMAWFQERIDNEKFNGFYSAYLIVTVRMFGEESGYYGGEVPLVAEARRKQVREYVGKCIETKDYSEWKRMKDNPAHWEFLWLWKEMDIKNLKVYFERIKNSDGGSSGLYYSYPSHKWQLEEFYESLLDDSTITLEDCEKLYFFNEEIKKFVFGSRATWDFPLVKDEEFIPITKLYKKLGFNPKDVITEVEIKDVPFAEAVYNIISENHEMYASEYVREREDVFKTSRRTKDKPLPNWSKDGKAIAFIEISVSEKKVYVKERAYNWSYHVSHRGEQFKFSADFEKEYDLEAVSEEEKTNLFHSLVTYYQPLVEENEGDLYLPIVNITLLVGEQDESESYWEKAKYTQNILRDNSEEWIETLQKMHDSMIEPEGERVQPYSNMLEVFKSIYINIFDYDWARMLLFMKQYATTQYGVHFGDSMLGSMAHHLEREMKRLLERKGIANLRKKITASFTPEDVDYIAFAADMIKNNLTASYQKSSQKFAAMLEKLLEKIEVVEEETYEETTYEIDQEEEMDEEDVFSTYKDEFVELKAAYNEDGREDYFEEGFNNRGYVKCVILKEEEQAYKTAIEYFIQIIKDGFPARFSFELTSSVDEYTLIYERPSDENPILKVDSNRFFTAALKYPELRDLVREYVKVSAENINVLEESEMEDDDSIIGRRPDFLAMAILVLSDPSGYDFLTTFDDFNGSVYYDQGYNGCHVLVTTFLRQCGINDDNVKNVAESIDEEKAGWFLIDMLQDWGYKDAKFAKENATKLLAHVEDDAKEMLEEILEDLEDEE